MFLSPPSKWPLPLPASVFNRFFVCAVFGSDFIRYICEIASAFIVSLDAVLIPEFNSCLVQDHHC